MKRLFVFLSLLLLTSCQKSIWWDDQDSNKTVLRVLAIGNSFSQDALAYVPFILRDLNIDVEIRIGILMKSSAILADHVDNFENKASVYTFYYYNGGDSWSTSSFKTIQWALTSSHWDVILTHQTSTNADDWDSRFQSELNLFVEQIQSVVDYPVTYAWMLSQARPAQKNGGINWSDEAILSRFSYTAAASKRVLEETSFEMIIPVGTAIQNARTVPEFKRMGDYAINPLNDSGNGYLCAFDGTHLQEGLPCQIASYSCIVSFLDYLGFDKQSIYDDETQVTAEWAAGKSIPGPHGTYIGSNNDNLKMAQMCAIMANQNPYTVTDIPSLFQ